MNRVGPARTRLEPHEHQQPTLGHILDRTMAECKQFRNELRQRHPLAVFVDVGQTSHSSVAATIAACHCS